MEKREPRHERRKTPRANANVVIRYRVLEETDNYDLSQSKNLGQGGIEVTTNRHFPPGTRLSMTVSFPFLDKKVEVVGEVVHSEVVSAGLIYRTHVHFRNLDESLRYQLGQYVEDLLSE